MGVCMGVCMRLYGCVCVWHVWQAKETNGASEPVAVNLYSSLQFVCVCDLCVRARVCVCEIQRERESNSRCSLWSCRHAPMLLPSGWLSGAEGGMVVAVKSLANGKIQGFKST